MFHGGFDWAAVEDVVDLSEWPHSPWSVDVVAELIERSLVMVHEDEGGIGRLSMLTSVAEYARTKLHEMRDAACTGAPMRHAHHYAALGSATQLAGLNTGDGRQKRRALDKELENLLAGIQSAASAGKHEIASYCTMAAAYVFQSSGPFSDAIAILKKSLAWPTQPDTQARLLGRTVWMLHQAGLPAEALTLNARALDVSRQSGNRHYEGRAIELQGHLYQAQGRLAEALAQYQEAAEIARETQNRYSESTAMSNIAEVHRELGDFSEAMRFYQETLRIHQELGNRRSEGIVIGNVAILLRRQGQAKAARDHYAQAIEIHREVGNRPFVGLALGNLAFLELSEGNTSGAERLFTEALAIHRSVGNRSSEGGTLGNLARLRHTQGDLATARSLYEQAIQLCDESAPVAGGMFRSGLALVCAEQGEFDLARTHLDEGERRVPSTHQVEQGSIQCHRAEVEALCGNTVSAKAALAEAEAISESLESGATPDLARSIDRAKRIIKNIIYRIQLNIQTMPILYGV